MISEVVKIDKLQKVKREQTKEKIINPIVNYDKIEDIVDRKIKEHEERKHDKS